MVSVIIPNYNHARYLPHRLDSVLNQTYQQLEVILLDDCSTDNSREVLARYAQADSRIRLVYNDQNSGSTFKQWNKGIALATGKYVWLAESDDYAAPDFLATLVTTLEANERVGLAYSNSYSVDENEALMPVPTWEPFLAELDATLWKHDFTQSGLALVHRFLSYRNIIPNASAVLLRRSTLAEVGPADESFKIMGDWIFWAKILAVSDVSYVARPLNYFRSHRNNVRSKTLVNGTALVETTQLLGIVRQYGKPDGGFYQLAFQQLLDNWFHALVYYQVPFGRHKLAYQNMSKLDPNFRSLFLQNLGRFLLRNRFSGLKMLVGDKLKRVIKRAIN